MKTKHLFLFLLSFAFLFSSCKKTINGTITDNFNQPVKDVRVYIHETAFESYSNSKGEFYLDYIPGKIDLIFEKDGYLDVSRNFTISERSNYPLGDIMMLRVPEFIGIYYKADTNYLAIPQIKLEYKSSIKEYGRTADYYKHYYIPNIDSVFTIKVKSLDNIEIYSFFNSNDNLTLTGIDNEGVVAIGKSMGVMSANHIRTIESIKEDIIQYSPSALKRKFNVTFGVTYVYINLKKSTYYSSTLGDYAYAFRFEEDK